LRTTTFVLVAAATMILAACETPTTQRYAISADNNQAIRSIGATGIGVRSFVGPADFSSNCRALGPMQVADNLTHTQYIQKAFEDELKIAGAFAQGTPRVTIGGRVNKIEFSSTKGITGGYWQIDLSLDSSNGKNLDVSEYYEFNSGFSANEACRNTAEAYSRAVQNLVGKAVKSSTFTALLK
jgi:hypothetical protein